MKYSKEHIIENIRQGKDREILGMMYSEVYPKVERYILKNSGSIDDSKDVFQEAILVFYNCVIEEKTDRILDFTGFIMRVSKNIWINKAKRASRQIGFDVLKTHEDPADSPLISLIMNEKWNAFSNLLNSLGEKCKEILTYSVYNKLSMKDIAVKMNLSGENAAKTQNYRCKQKMAEIVLGNKALKDLLKS